MPEDMEVVSVRARVEPGNLAVESRPSKAIPAGVRLRICISNVPPGDAAAAGLGIPLGLALVSRRRVR